MSFRTKLLVAFTLTVLGSVALVSWAVSALMSRAFEEFDNQRAEVLLAQFRRDYLQRGRDVIRRVQGVAGTEIVRQVALEMARPAPDYSGFVHEARALAVTHGLDFLELVADDGRIVSSAHWPARFGYKHDELTRPVDWKAQGAFLEREETPEENVVGLMAVGVIQPAERRLYVQGGQRLNKEFLASMALPAGMRALLYTFGSSGFLPQALIGASESLSNAVKLAPLIEEVRRDGHEVTRTIQWTAEGASSETFHAIPLTGRAKDLLAVLLVGSSRRELAAYSSFIRRMAIGLGTAGVLFGVLLSYWATGSLTRGIRELAMGARRVALGLWDTRVSVRSTDEIGQLGKAFNQMTQQLVEQRERAIQAERVAAWRELARRLAHELKNPLFPLQITVENLKRAREHHPEQFDEVFRESTTTLLAELANLKTIIGRFSDFARMPRPQLEPVNLNDVVAQVSRLFEGQLQADGRPRIELEIHLDEHVPSLQADPEHLKRVLHNLVLNAIDAMSNGGKLTLRTQRQDGMLRLEVSDTGVGLAKEECERLFTPYYTTKQHGTGLGLAIVQSIVSDHGGRISVRSTPNVGTTFLLDLPVTPRNE